VRFLWMIAVVTGPHRGGPLSPGGTARRLYAIRRKTRPPKASFHPPSTTPSHTPPGKPITSSAAITHDGSASLAGGAKPLSCAKTLAPHRGAITYFLGHDTLTKATALPV
jgi:hypothetical protein